MEMERINDNTIRVMIENEDLQDRGTSVRDLLSDRNKIESFFYNILSEIDTAEDFVDNDKVSFQVLPNQNGLELFISRLDDQDALNDLLANIVGDRSEESNTSQVSSEAIDDVSFEQKMALMSRDDQTVEKSESVVGHVDLVELTDFEELLALSERLADFTGKSTVYAYQDRYIMVLDTTAADMAREAFNTLSATIVEFGRYSQLSQSVLDEHGQVLFKDNAVNALNQFFAKA
ncbi:adapter protein MecA [Fructobacillus pseudoficulneus]|uniref:Adapter protein MecA n=1 Tax=Fructobacillus pseudoficulneus TaxID=220714 RepID=A0A3F3GTM5_9LACO|nr:adaptor protein MecA [Fructobacillus pseudoficulneus]GAP02821.1 adapter protein MecA [Fructobacillus pseudoficulneus]SEH40200.1 adapter protein MecA 1/2 [Fructobacillus pseudoficulneus]